MRLLTCLVAACLSTVASTARAENPPFILQWGSPGSGNGQFSVATNKLANGPTGNIYALDTATGSERVQAFDNNGVFITKWGSFGSGPGEFGAATNAIAAGPDGSVYVCDDRIQKFTSSGAYVTEWGGYGSGDGQFIGCYGMDTDVLGNLYIADAGNDRIEVFSPSGTFLRKWGVSGNGPGQLNLPLVIAVEPAGTVVVGDLPPGMRRIQRFTSDGTYVLTFDTSGEGHLGSSPVQVCADPDGRVIYADWENNRVVVFAPDGSFGAQWGTLGSGPGQFSGPTGVTADAQGNIFVFDRDNARVQKFGYVTPTRSTTWGRIKAIYK